MSYSNANPKKQDFSQIRQIFWPIEWHENKKFLPMAFMMFFILFNYSVLRSVKDGFVVIAVGAEAISFLKTYCVLPSAVLVMIFYAKLCNIMTQNQVFYTMTSLFIAFFAIFAFVLYPYPDFFHPNEAHIENLSHGYPMLKWFIRIAGKWSYALFYVFAELWGSVMLSLLFWQFANHITKTSEAKRFYSMFGLLGNGSLLSIPFILNYLLSEDANIVSKDLKFIPVMCLMILTGFIVMYLYYWINKNVLTDPLLYQADNSGKSSKKSKVKLSLSDSFKMIFQSKYLGLLVTLIIAYGISINLVEGVWKANIKSLYPTKESYTTYMANFQGYQGLAAIIFMLVGSNILRAVSWKTAAMLTPLMILVTGLAFFAFTIFDQTIGLHLAAFLGTGPLALAVALGTIQNILSKATKYSLFDSTKEMAYIPLDDEMKTKGKAAVDVIGARFGKSGGAVIQSTFFILFPLLSFTDAVPYFASIFFVIVILWLFAVHGLSKEYNKMVNNNESSK